MLKTWRLTGGNVLCLVGVPVAFPYGCDVSLYMFSAVKTRSSFPASHLLCFFGFPVAFPYGCDVSLYMFSAVKA